MRILMISAGMAALAMSSAGLAQQAPVAPVVQADDASEPGEVEAGTQDSAVPETSSYVCAISGQCGGDDGPVATMAAEPTRGFHIASRVAPPPPPPPPPSSARSGAGRSWQASRTNGYVQRSLASAGYQRGAGRDRPARNVGSVSYMSRPGLLFAFDMGSSALTTSAQARAKTFAQALNMDEMRGRRFQIAAIGVRGGGDGQRQAQMVADYLVAQGIDRGRVEVRSGTPGRVVRSRGRTAPADTGGRIEATLLS